VGEYGDQKVKQRISDYSEDDCRAIRVVLDAMRTMRVKQASV
jgi:predicted RecB family nuclease